MKEKQETPPSRAGSEEPGQHAMSGCCILPHHAGPRKRYRWVEARWVQRLIKAGLSLAVLRAGCAV